MLKKIATIILFPVWFPLGIFLRCRHRLRLKKILKLKRESRLLKQQNRILQARFDRVDPELKAEILEQEKLEKQQLGINRILK